MQLTIRGSYLRTAFLGRLNEWAFASMLFMWGVVLLFPMVTFDGRAYSAFRLLVGEDMLGTLFAIGGLIRLSVLFANGFWRPMYYVRAWMALTSMMAWLTITLGFASSGTFGTWIALYPVLTVFEGVNVFRAMIDAAQAEREARKTGA